MLSGAGRLRSGPALAIAATLYALAGLLASCGSPAAKDGGRRTTPATAPAHPVTGPHLVVVIDENHSYDQIIGAAIAPRANQLARTGVSLTNFYATTHPSLPNYIAMTSGSTQGITSDCGKCDIQVPNLIDQLERAKVSWHVYAQGFPGECSRTRVRGAYAKKHVPFLYYRSVFTQPARCAKVVGIDQFWSDTRNGSLPSVSFVIPDLDNDMHGAGEGMDPVKLVEQADLTLGRVVDALRLPWNWTDGTRLVVTWDEGGGGHEARTSCCDGRSKGGHIPTLVSGPDLEAGPDSTDYDHYDLLRSFEARYRLPLLGHAADAVSKPIPSIVGT